jgi:predicted transcriptional regulator
MVKNESKTPDIVGLATDVVAAYVRNNPVPAADLRPLMDSVHAALRRVAGSQPVEAPKPAIAVENSVTPDYIVCLEDGGCYKSLRRHLRAKYNMSPEEYRAKWGLPADYPMVAPNYAKARSDLAKAIGLGRLDNYNVAA